MNSAIFYPLLYSSLFFLVIDLFAWRAIRALLKSKPKWLIRTAFIIPFGILLCVIGSFAYYITSEREQQYSDFRTFYSAFTMSLYLSKLVFSLFVLMEDVLKLFGWMKRRFQKKQAHKEAKKGKLSRADFIYSAGAVTAAVPFYLMMRGTYKNAYNYQVHRIKLEIPNLPKAFKGKTIVQVSDIHSGSLSDKDAVYRGVKMINDLKPDLFFFTGDLVNNFAVEADTYVDMFREIKADIGTYSILGNHDYGLYHNWERKSDMEANFQGILKAHEEIGWKLMLNDHEEIGIQGQKLGLIGVENWGHSSRFPKRGDLDLAQKGMGDVKAKLLLSHDPSHWDRVVRQQHPDIAAMFAGHTHGAQMGIENKYFKWSPVQYIYKQWAGLYQSQDQQLYVNRGFGFIGYPGRVGIMPEITLFELG